MEKGISELMEEKMKELEEGLRKRLINSLYNGYWKTVPVYELPRDRVKLIVSPPTGDYDIVNEDGTITSHREAGTI